MAVAVVLVMVWCSAVAAAGMLSIAAAAARFDP
jgi:hypothetical protein